MDINPLVRHEAVDHQEDRVLQSSTGSGMRIKLILSQLQSLKTIPQVTNSRQTRLYYCGAIFLRMDDNVIRLFNKQINKFTKREMI